MYKYPKIETVYKRDMDGTKKLLDGVFRSAEVCLLSSCPIWAAYEKLDGSNHQIYWDGHTIKLGGRTEHPCRSQVDRIGSILLLHRPYRESGAADRT